MERMLKTHLPGGGFSGVSPARSRAMAAVRSYGNKTTEGRLRFGLVRRGIRGWRLRPTGLQGSPDFLFPSAGVVIFVDGCFWHGCPQCGHVPKTNRMFWAAKLARTRQRDEETTERLEAAGYCVLRFWEHELRDQLGSCVTRIEAALGRSRR